MKGSLINRLLENHFTDKIKVGDRATVFHYTDRTPYEVVEVKDCNHIKVRELAHKSIGEPMSNQWELYSDDTKLIISLARRRMKWYKEIIATKQDLAREDEMTKYWLAMNGFDIDTILRNGKQTKYHKIDISFGNAEYYFDYEF